MIFCAQNYTRQYKFRHFRWGFFFSLLFLSCNSVPFFFFRPDERRSRSWLLISPRISANSRAELRRWLRLLLLLLLLPKIIWKKRWSCSGRGIVIITQPNQNDDLTAKLRSNLTDSSWQPFCAFLEQQQQFRHQETSGARWAWEIINVNYHRFDWFLLIINFKKKSRFLRSNAHLLVWNIKVKWH